jgi:hypothetical protein
VAAYGLDGNEVDRFKRWEVDAEDIGYADVALRAAPVVRCPGVEEHASTTRPGGLALDSQERAAPEINCKVVWMTRSEWQEGVEASLDKAVQDRCLARVSLRRIEHAPTVEGVADGTCVRFQLVRFRVS